MKLIEAHENMEGLFMVNFRIPISGMRGNTALPAIIFPYIGPTRREVKRLVVQWIKGDSCVIEPHRINVYQLNQR